MMEMPVCNLIWPVYLGYFVYLNYRWLMAAGHNFGCKDTANAASADVVFTALLIIISFSFCQLQLPVFSASVMVFHLSVLIFKPGWIANWIHSNDER